MITKETRKESYKHIVKTLGERQKQCLMGLNELGSATANELAWHLYKKEITPLFSRNFVHPRLNELIEQGLVQVIGKKIDPTTNRKVVVYKVKKNG